jgi:curli biogenesis system outer membrane secretion channel CsgG
MKNYKSIFKNLNWNTLRYGCSVFLGGFFLCLGLYSKTVAAENEIPMGAAYQGPKAVIAVGDFTVQVREAPEDIGDGLREMLQTALFESNHFIVVDRSDTAGISAEKLLSDSFLKDVNAILQPGQMHPAEILVYGAVTTLEGEGCGLRLKLPGAAVKVGGKYHHAKVGIDLRLVDTASGKILAAKSVNSSTLSASCEVGASKNNTDLPFKLKVVKNTPLELAIRDCIYRAVISLRAMIPQRLFRYKEP